MRTLHFGLRVSDLENSLTFYQALGYEVVGEVPETPIGRLVMLRLPDDEFVSIELVYDPSTPLEPGNALSHLAVHVQNMGETLGRLAEHGLDAEQGIKQDDGMWTAFLTDPDGLKIELVQWSTGHPAGLSAADWAGSDS